MRSLQLAFLVVVSGAAALGTGCAHQYTYVPVGPGSGGGPASQYPVPPQAPQGTAYLTSFGFTDFDTGQGGSQRMLHARLAVSNGSATTWEVDGRQQFVVAPGLAPQPPSFMNTNAGQGPVYSIAPGAANVFDLYFAMPPGLEQPESLSGFALDWSLNAGGQVVQEQTAFERFADAGYSYASYPPYVYVGLGFGVVEIAAHVPGGNPGASTGADQDVGEVLADTAPERQHLVCSRAYVRDAALVDEPLGDRCHQCRRPREDAGVRPSRLELRQPSLE